jgi:alpha-D-ribose 1-methylphosphonate 5-triphosphate synthase subunit PhnG
MTVQGQEQHDDDARRRWLAVLARAGRDELERAAAALSPAAHSEPVRKPESGMVMLRGRVGGTGDAFNLGEASVTRCALRVGAHLGVGYTLGRDRRKAELVALFDALLQDEVRRPALLREVVEPLARAQAEAREARSREMAASKVEFFTMVRGEAA